LGDEKEGYKMKLSVLAEIVGFFIGVIGFGYGIFSLIETYSYPLIILAAVLTCIGLLYFFKWSKAIFRKLNIDI